MLERQDFPILANLETYKARAEEKTRQDKYRLYGCNSVWKSNAKLSGGLRTGGETGPPLKIAPRDFHFRDRLAQRKAPSQLGAPASRQLGGVSISGAGLVSPSLFPGSHPLSSLLFPCPLLPTRSVSLSFFRAKLCATHPHLFSASLFF